MKSLYFILLFFFASSCVGVNNKMVETEVSGSYTNDLNILDKIKKDNPNNSISWSVDLINQTYDDPHRLLKFEKINGEQRLISFTSIRDNLNILDIKGLSALQKLYISNSQLRSLDISNNERLTVLHCENSPIAKLDLSNNLALKELTVINTKIMSLDLSKQTGLEVFHCIGNLLKDINLSKNTKLETIWLSGNELTSIDLSKNTELVALICDSNQLSTLDLSHNINLEYLNIEGNLLGDNSVDICSHTICIADLYPSEASSIYKSHTCEYTYYQDNIGVDIEQVPSIYSTILYADPEKNKIKGVKFYLAFDITNNTNENVYISFPEYIYNKKYTDNGYIGRRKSIHVYANYNGKLEYVLGNKEIDGLEKLENTPKEYIFITYHKIKQDSSVQSLLSSYLEKMKSEDRDTLNVGTISELKQKESPILNLLENDRIVISFGRNDLYIKPIPVQIK